MVPATLGIGAHDNSVLVPIAISLLCDLAKRTLNRAWEFYVQEVRLWVEIILA